MTILVPVPWFRAPGAWLKEETLLAAVPKAALLFLSQGRLAGSQHF